MHKLLDKTQIIEILSSDNQEIFKEANRKRSLHKGEYIHLRGLIEFTNICKQNCFYCGLRCGNKNIERYRLTKEEIINSVKQSIQLGYKTVVLQGGEDTYWDTDKTCDLIKEIKKNDIALTLSIGEKTYDEYKAFKIAGADRYLLRIETTDENLYKKLHPNMSHKKRFECLENIKKLGFETGTGCLVGLPEQSIESLANDILFFKELNADMVGIGPFIPHPETPLAGEKKDNFDLSLRVMALTRIILPDINIPATTAMETLKKDGRNIALNSGANVVMINITNEKYKHKYEIYPNKASKVNLPKDRKVSSTKGFRLDKD